MTRPGRVLLVLLTGVALLLLSACRTTVGEQYTAGEEFEKYEVEQGILHANGLAWEYRVEGLRINTSVYYEFRLTNLSERTLANLRTYPNLPEWDGSAYEAGTMTPGRMVLMKWQWSGDRLPNGIRVEWDGGSTVIPVWDRNAPGA